MWDDYMHLLLDRDKRVYKLKLEGKSGAVTFSLNVTYTHINKSINMAGCSSFIN